MSQITKNFQKLKAEIPDNVKIVLAAKCRTPEEIKEVIAAGATDLGENYVQEAEDMFNALGDAAKNIRWHMIGSLQKNKINKALPMFDVVQTVDSIKIAEDLGVRAGRLNKKISVFIEINIGNEFNKAGLKPDYDLVYGLALAISKQEFLELTGIMTMGPYSGDPEAIRPYFKQAKTIFDQLKDAGLENTKMEYLSMGMSHSYKVAVEEGSNMIRPGTVVFGGR
jgi:PLP dependent protein